MHLILLGHFYIENHDLNCIHLVDIYKPLQVCIASTMCHKYTMLFEVALEKYPTFGINGEFSGFTFKHTIIFFDIILHTTRVNSENNEVSRKYLAKSNQKDL